MSGFDMGVSSLFLLVSEKPLQVIVRPRKYNRALRTFLDFKPNALIFVQEIRDGPDRAEIRQKLTRASS
jgi:hypothetical protein